MADPLVDLCAGLSIDDVEKIPITISEEIESSFEGSHVLIANVLVPRSMFRRIWNLRHNLIWKILDDNVALLSFSDKLDYTRVLKGRPWLSLCCPRTGSAINSDVVHALYLALLGRASWCSDWFVESQIRILKVSHRGMEISCTLRYERLPLFCLSSRSC